MSDLIDNICNTCGESIKKVWINSIVKVDSQSNRRNYFLDLVDILDLIINTYFHKIPKLLINKYIINEDTKTIEAVKSLLSEIFEKLYKIGHEELIFFDSNLTTNEISNLRELADVKEFELLSEGELRCLHYYFSKIDNALSELITISEDDYKQRITELILSHNKANKFLIHDYYRHERKRKILDRNHNILPIMVYNNNPKNQFNKLVMEFEDKQNIIELLKINASNAPQKIGVEGFFRQLIKDSNFPYDWECERIQNLTGIAKSDATELIDWAIIQGTNSNNKKFTILGSLLYVFLERLSEEDKQFITTILIKYSLIFERNLVDKFNTKIQNSTELNLQQTIFMDYGPDFKWRTSSDNQLDYQNFLQKPYNLFDVGFLKRGIEQSQSVCRIEYPKQYPLGTGFLIGKNNLLLTNYHVLMGHINDNLQTNIENVFLRFACITDEEGNESEGIVIKLAKKNPLAFSKQDDLDFLLLQVDDEILQYDKLKPTQWELTLPSIKSGLHILQHPEGEAMKLSPVANGITGVYQDTGHIQYVTTAKSGSSGSPCFNDDWKVVALHHAQRSTAFGSIRQGILFSAIHEQIKEFL